MATSLAFRFNMKLTYGAMLSLRFHDDCRLSDVEAESFDAKYKVLPRWPARRGWQDVFFPFPFPFLFRATKLYGCSL